MKTRFLFLYHNAVVHPICGVLWFFEIGTAFADRWHDRSYVPGQDQRAEGVR